MNVATVVKAATAVKVRTPGRPVVAGLLAAALAVLVVLVATELRGDEYEARVSLLATPAGEAAQYGEVVALALPALVEIARSPSVLEAAASSGMAPEELGDNVAVELVPASGLARLSVRAPTARTADEAATAIARAMVAANLLAPAATLRLLDERPDVTQVAPDRTLGLGLALAAAVVAGVATGVVCQSRGRGTTSVRTALAGAPVTMLDADAPDAPERLAALCAAAARSPRVVAVVPDLADDAQELAKRMPATSLDPTEGTALIAVTPRKGAQAELATVLAALQEDTVLVAVVLT